VKILVYIPFNIFISIYSLKIMHVFSDEDDDEGDDSLSILNSALLLILGKFWL
jgi:hypothetical protein